jgi:kynurenine formamidase
MKKYLSTISAIVLLAFASCQEKQAPKIVFPSPLEIIDLGNLVTEDLPEQIWGMELMKSMGFEKSNHFEVINWEFPAGTGKVSGSNAYYTLFNHGGTHVDGPCHVDFEGGLDSYPIEKFVGPLKVFDVSSYPNGRTVPVEVFLGKVTAGDVVILYTNWKPPQSGKSQPEHITLSHKTAEYLAELPVRAFCTDAFSADSFGDTIDPIITDTQTAKALPIHHSFLSRAIPIYEELVNVEKLLTKQNMMFVGVPLSIKDGDGIPVRPVAFIY